MVERWVTMEGIEGLGRSYQIRVTEEVASSTADAPVIPHDDRPLSDVWVYVTLALMAVSCVGCVCSCLLYHKFQQWKHHTDTMVGEAGSSLGSGRDSPGLRDLEEESLPSYTLVTGLPSYEQAIEQLKEARKLSHSQMSPLSATHLLHCYTTQPSLPPPPPPTPPPSLPDIKS